LQTFFKVPGFSADQAEKKVFHEFLDTLMRYFVFSAFLSLPDHRLE